MKILDRSLTAEEYAAFDRYLKNTVMKKCCALPLNRKQAVSCKSQNTAFRLPRLSRIEEIVYHFLHVDGGDAVALEHGDKIPELFLAERYVREFYRFAAAVFRDGHNYAV